MKWNEIFILMFLLIKISVKLLNLTEKFIDNLWEIIKKWNDLFSYLIIMIITLVSLVFGFEEDNEDSCKKRMYE